MTGAEIVPGLAVAAGRAALSEEKSVKKQLAEIAKDSPSMQRAAEHYARRIEIRQAVINRLFEPLAKWAGVSRAYFEEDGDFAQDMGERVADIPEEELTTPQPSVAVPAMQGLGYSLDEPDLKEMYLNLLATATDNRRREEAHPAFAEIIRQLSSDEAALLSNFLEAKRLPVIEARKTNENESGYYTLQTHIADLHDMDTMERSEAPLLSMWVDNWVRLGLFTVSYTTSLLGEGSYDWADLRPEMERLRAEHAGTGASVIFAKGILEVTDFGARFAAAVTPSKVASPEEDE